MALTSGLVLASITSLFAATWDDGGPDNEYSTALNWSDDLVPTNATNSTQEISGSFTVERTVGSTSGRTFVQNGAVLNVTSGDHDDSQPGNTVRNFVGNGSAGTVNLSGVNTVYGIGHVLAIAHSSNSNGDFRQTNGDLNVYRGGNSLIGGYGGIFSRGHSISIGGNSTGNNVAGLYEISGGSLNTRVGVAVGNNGIFSIVGSSATEIRLGGSNSDTGWFALSSDATLKASIDSAGVTPIFVEDKTNSSTITPEVELQSGSLLDLSFVGSTVYGSWTLIEVENADIVDNGLALAPGVDSNWTFEIDNSGTNGLLKISYLAPPTMVSSVSGLLPYLDDDNVNVVMVPGTYQIDTAHAANAVLEEDSSYSLFSFSGNNSMFDFTGVKFEFDTGLFRSLGSVDVREIAVWGNDLVLKNLTMEDIGTTRPTKRAQAVLLDGARNRIEGFTVTTRGSRPYGYGDIFGKGAGPVIGHNKHSAILIRGDDNHLKDSTVYHRSYGHGIFVQGGVDILIEGCYVEGELRTTNEVLAEAGTGSRADDVGFMTVWGHPLAAGHTFCLQEDGIRAYNTGRGPDGNTRNNENLTVIDCTVKRMRSGVTIGFTNGIQHVENCVAVQCENAYWIQNGNLINSAADAQVGPVLSSPYGNSGSKNVDIAILKSDGFETNKVLAYLAGPNDDVTFRSSDANVNQDIRVLVGGPREGMRYSSADTGLSANNSELTNLTNYPVELSSSSSNYSVESWGTVTDSGSNNNVTSATNNICGGFGMSEIVHAEEYCSGSGTTEEPIDGGGTSIGSINDGDWLCFDNFIFGSGPKYLKAVAAGDSGGSIEIRLGSVSGTLIGTVNIAASVIPDQWETVSGVLTHTRGVHDVYLVFKGGAGNLFNLDSFSFTHWNIDPFERDTDHLLAHWKFDEGSGTVAADSTSNGFDGTISGATWASGAKQNALAFDGTASTVDVPASLLNAVDNELTISMWVYGDASQPANDSLIYAQEGSSRILNIHLPYGNSQVYWDAGGTGGYDRVNRTANDSQFKGQWNHWTFVKSTTDQDMLIYQNGVLHAAEQGGGQEVGNPTVPISIGSRLGTSNYSGLIDEVMFHDVALSEMEIKALYESVELNVAPVALPESVSTPENAAVPILLQGSDDNDDLLDFLVATGPSNGALSGVPPNLTYTPNTSFHGSDSFTFTVDDGFYASAPETVTITVEPATYTLAYTAGDNGSISGVTPQSVVSGENGSTVSAVAGPNYSFVDWSDGSTDNPRTDFNVTSDLSVIANFVANYSELENWRYANFGTYDNTGIAADDFDADFDGIYNLVEYATGLDPNDSSEVEAIKIGPSEANPGEMEVTFDRIADPSLNYSLEGTSALSASSWPEIWSGTGSADDTVVIPSSMWPNNETEYFFRIKVSY